MLHSQLAASSPTFHLWQNAKSSLVFAVCAQWGCTAPVSCFRSTRLRVKPETWTEEKGRAICQSIGYSRWDAQLVQPEMKQKLLCERFSSDAQFFFFYNLCFDRGTYFKSGQQRADANDGFLLMKSNFNPQASILQQLALQWVSW